MVEAPKIDEKNNLTTYVYTHLFVHICKYTYILIGLLLYMDLFYTGIMSVFCVIC